ncbi:MAG TPA: type II toxin-antitoxin system RelE/ParE family toxin [Candidatus Paceibacterota bacterium]|nr:type II toxin-antitoxin system RelE/ParE family toxin [Candidatus Paceibacterota bacterium]
MSWLATPETDEDLIAARNFIAVDNESAARDFLDAAFEAFDRLAQFPEMGLPARFRHRDLKGVRFFVLAPPFNRWLVFYRPAGQDIEIKRVLYGNVNWRQEPERFF